jgi:hypothetical protein
MTSFDLVRSKFAKDFRIEPCDHWATPTSLVFDLLAQGETVRLNLDDEDLFELAELLQTAAEDRQKQKAAEEKRLDAEREAAG